MLVGHGTDGRTGTDEERDGAVTVEKIVLLGAGGHAYSIIDSIISRKQYEIIGITDLKHQAGERVMSCEVIGDDGLLIEIFKKGVKYAFVSLGSIGDTSLKEKLCWKLNEIGFVLPIIADNSAHISNETMLGVGIYIGKKAVINAGSSIGDHAIINTGSIIEHTCNIANFTHVAPGAIVCGDVSIGSHTHIGAGAVVIQGCTIGENCIIGAGSVVLNDIPDNVVAYGNPCKVVRRND